LNRLTLNCATTESSGSTASELIDDFIRVFDAYEIDKTMISAIVTDTEPTMNAFGKSMGLKHNIPWVGCVDHVLELCTGKAFDDSVYKDNVGCMKSARKLVGYFRHSNQKLEQLKSVQRTLYEVEEVNKSPLVPIEDCATRWWSTYSMLERLVNLRRFIALVNVPEDHILTVEQWMVAEDIVKVLKPFMLVQKHFEGEKYVTISSVCFLLEKIRQTIDKTLASNDTVRVNQIVEELGKKFVEYWGNGLDPVREYLTLGPRQRVKGYQPAHLMSAFLDPRSKHLAGFDERSKQLIYDMVREEMIKLNDVENEVGLISPPTRKSQLAELFDGDIDEQDSGKFDLDYELNSYKMVQRIPYFYDENGVEKPNSPLQWWSVNTKKFPRLAMLAKKYLCIPATSAPAERLFSHAGLIITEKRNRLHEDVAADLIYLNMNWSKIQSMETSDLD
jgi:hypothetical protein